MKENVSSTLTTLEQMQRQLKDEKEATVIILQKRLSTLEKKKKGYLEKIKYANNEMKETRETICYIQGHDWTPWIEYEGPLDRDWYYARGCEVCGKTERPTKTIDSYLTEKQWEAEKQKRQNKSNQKIKKKGGISGKV